MPAHQVKLWSDNNFATETLQLRHVENFAALIPQWFRSAQLHSPPLVPAFPSARPRESGDPALSSGFPLARERTEILSSSPHIRRMHGAPHPTSVECRRRSASTGSGLPLPRRDMSLLSAPR